jgi:glyoxylate utilization-related uncharacterized protein
VFELVHGSAHAPCIVHIIGNRLDDWTRSRVLGGRVLNSHLVDYALAFEVQIVELETGGGAGTDIEGPTEVIDVVTGNVETMALGFVVSKNRWSTKVKVEMIV